MSCSRCGFFNLPGGAACVACGLPLGQGGGVAVATEPPRATPLQKKLRRVQKTVFGSAGAVEAARLPFRAIALGLVPGLPQALAGRSRLAAGLAGGWAAGMALAACLFGHPLSTLSLGAAISVHFYGAFLPWRDRLRSLRVRDRLLLTLAAYALLVGGLYVPAQGLAERFVTPVEIVGMEAPPLIQKGDRILLRPPRGLPDYGTVTAIDTGRFGLAFDRVLGRPGDHIALSGGQWTRNGAPLAESHRPLVAGPLPDRIDIRVPAGQVFLWPSLNIRAYGNARPDPALGLHPASSIAGVAWRRAAPFGRRGPFDAP